MKPTLSIEINQHVVVSLGIQSLWAMGVIQVQSALEAELMTVIQPLRLLFKRDGELS